MDSNTERVCENCGTDWRGSVECPVCGALDNLNGVVTVCAWCPTHKALTADAIAQGLDVTHGMCDVCAAREWSQAVMARGGERAKAKALAGAR